MDRIFGDVQAIFHSSRVDLSIIQFEIQAPGCGLWLNYLEDGTPLSK